MPDILTKNALCNEQKKLEIKLMASVRKDNRKIETRIVMAMDAYETGAEDINLGREDGRR